MTTDLVKSHMQLNHELANLKNELTTLWNNSKKKKEESLSKMLNFRGEIKEMEAVMAAKEESYASFYAMAQPLLNMVLLNPLPLTGELETFFTDILHHIKDLTTAAEAEAFRIAHLRAAHQTQVAFIQRKSKEIYVAMNEGKKSVDTYAILLQAKIQKLEEQLSIQINHSGLGISL